MNLYLQFFGLNEAPFSITPDPAFVYLSAAHRDALAHLLYGVGQGGAGGFVQLTGEVGTGKTTLCRLLLEQVPEDTQVALILNPLVTPRELLATLCEELGIDTAGMVDSNKAMVDSLNRFLLAQHAINRRVVVVIDEAQNLSPEALEQVRLLTNLETAKEKLLQMVLLGQPELRALLQRQSLRQLSQRITARYHLTPLGPEETHAYIRHRMKVAGASQNPFRRSAMRALYRRSAGVPRLINIIADRALVGAYAKETSTIGARLIQDAANEVQPNEISMQNHRWSAIVATAAAAALVLVSLGIFGFPQFAGKLFPPQQQNGAEVTHESVEETPVLSLETVPLLESTAGSDAVGGVLAPPLNKSLLPDKLDISWLEMQHAQAWQSMATLWQDQDGAKNIELACGGVQGLGYTCLSDHGSWARVEQLGLPVLLVIQSEDPKYLPLQGISTDGLLVGNESSSIEVSRNAVESQWLGEFIIPWPQAPDWPIEIRRGETGKAVEIAIKMANIAQPAWLGGDAFDEEFEVWLIAFQRRHGLKADGILGPKTLLYLMAPTISQPRLITPQDGKS